MTATTETPTTTEITVTTRDVTDRSGSYTADAAPAVGTLITVTGRGGSRTARITHAETPSPTRRPRYHWIRWEDAGETAAAPRSLGAGAPAPAPAAAPKKSGRKASSPRPKGKGWRKVGSAWTRVPERVAEDDAGGLVGYSPFTGRRYDD